MYAQSSAYTAGQYVSHRAAYTATTTSTVANSTNLIIVAAASNVNIKVGFSVSGTGVASGTTVVQIAGTYVKLSTAIAASSSSLTLTFTSTSEIFRAQADHPANTGIAPKARIPQWTLVRVYSNYSSGVAYTLDPSDALKNPYVKHGGTIWRAVSPSTGVTPGSDEAVWIRGDACGKLLTSCKIRYQAVPQIYGTAYDADAVPAYELDTAVTLPFGGFPGSTKFR